MVKLALCDNEGLISPSLSQSASFTISFEVNIHSAADAKIIQVGLVIHPRKRIIRQGKPGHLNGESESELEDEKSGNRDENLVFDIIEDDGESTTLSSLGQTMNLFSLLSFESRSHAENFTNHFCTF